MLSLTLALALQAPANVPRDAEAVWPIMPRVTAAPGSNVSLHQSIHAVTATLLDVPPTDTSGPKTEVGYETLSLFKNTTANEGQVDIEVAFDSWRSGFGQAIKVEALWSDQPVQPAGPVMSLQPMPEKGQMGRYAIRYRVTVKKQATHSLKLKFKLPVGVSGVDREERMVAYRVVDINQASALEQFRMSVKFTPLQVFAPIEAKPDWGWEVGSSGAYLKLDGKASNRDAVLVYRYYPPRF